MNSYNINGVEMDVVRVETTHTLLRSKFDTTRWIANELLARYAPVTDLSNVLRRPERLAIIYGEVGTGKTTLAAKFLRLSECMNMPRVRIVDDLKTDAFVDNFHTAPFRHGAEFIFVLMTSLYPPYEVLKNFPIQIRCFMQDGKYEYTIS